MTDPALLLTPEALAAPDWAERVIALLPESLVPDAEAEDYDADEDPREDLDDLCEEFLSRPEAIAHPDWSRVLRALVSLSANYWELTEDAYDEALDPDNAEDDEGGVVEMISDLGLSTIGDAFTLLAQQSAVERDDWPELVRHVLAEKKARFGTGLFLSYGWEEADELFEADHVRTHAQARTLWQEANEILPLESTSP